MRTIAIVFFCLAALVGGLEFPAVAAPPNVVVIVSDDHHWHDYGFMGHPHVRTPSLDKLAAESLVFTHGYVPSSLCRPSLATILTGLYPHQHKITSNDPPLSKQPATPAGKAAFEAARQEMINYIDKVPTLPRMLGEQGYVSFQTGKWWEGHYRRGGFTDGMSVGGRHGDAGLEIGRKTMQPMFDFVDRAQKENQPFFLWYAPFLPHSPHNAPERITAKYREFAPNQETAKYWGCIDWLDETCGQLLAFLDERKLTENTLIVYIADNGWLQDPTADRYAPKSKQSPYDGGLRTPIMFRLPGKIKPRRSEQPAVSIDLAPTILTALGRKPTPEMQGINLLDDQATAGRKAIFGECFEHNAVDIHDPASSLKYRWTIENSLKLILPNAERVGGEIELYDLAADPQETKNLAAERSSDVARLRKNLDDWWAGQGAAK